MGSLLVFLAYPMHVRSRPWLTALCIAHDVVFALTTALIYNLSIEAITITYVAANTTAASMLL